MSSRSRILYISSSWPRGGTFGGQIRALHIGRALQAIGDVTLLMIGSDAGDVDALRQTAAEFRIEPPMLPLATPNRSPVQQFRRLFDSRYLNVHGHALSPTDRARLIHLHSHFDLVWVSNSRTPNLAQRWYWPNAHLDLDDIPSTYLGTIARSAGSYKERLRARIEQRLFQRKEAHFSRRFSTLSVCSTQDRLYLGNLKSIHVIPNGFERPSALPLRATRPAVPRIGFIGLYSYQPNLDGMRWFLSNCWPLITAAVPNVRLRLVGKDTTGPLRPSNSSVDALGWLSSPSEEIATWNAMVVPIRIGGGTRVKIADAFSRKCPVVATSIGAFGYEVSDQNQLRIADKPQAFANACIELIRDPAAGTDMAERAWLDFIEKWTWDKISPKVWAAAEECLIKRSVHR